MQSTCRYEYVSGYGWVARGDRPSSEALDELNPRSKAMDITPLYYINLNVCANPSLPVMYMHLDTFLYTYAQIDAWTLPYIRS